MITVMQWADFRLGRPASTEADFFEAKLAMIGGCRGCGATIAAYNAYPSRSGYWACADCIGDRGFSSCKEANKVEFPDERNP